MKTLIRLLRGATWVLLTACSAGTEDAGAGGTASPIGPGGTAANNGNPSNQGGAGGTESNGAAAGNSSVGLSGAAGVDGSLGPSAGAGGAGDAMGGAGGGGGVAVIDECALAPGSITADVTSVTVTNLQGASPSKGDTLRIEITVENTGEAVAEVSVTALLDSRRFSEYTGVPLGTTTVVLCRGSNVLTVEGGPFLASAAQDKHYALGSGDYTVSSVSLIPTGGAPFSDTDFTGQEFNLATSGALLVPVVYDAGYLPAINGHDASTVEEFLVDSFTRPNQIFTPSGADPDGAGDTATFAGGFDEMMGVKHHFRTFDGFPGETTTEDGWCEDAAAYGQTVLGMSEAWTGSGTLDSRHGFDYLIALTPNMGGGVACGWLDVQVSGMINDDHDRQQVIAVHESGHIFGAPHCDDVGDGSGGALQGYVMCSGEKHAAYPANFVWHSTSTDQMGSHWD